MLFLFLSIYLGKWLHLRGKKRSILWNKNIGKFPFAFTWRYGCTKFPIKSHSFAQKFKSNDTNYNSNIFKDALFQSLDMSAPNPDFFDSCQAVNLFSTFCHKTFHGKIVNLSMARFQTKSLSFLQQTPNIKVANMKLMKIRLNISYLPNCKHHHMNESKLLGADAYLIRV